jgi:chaperonin GroES
MKLKPLYDKIVVQPLVAEDVTKAGIVLPDTAKEKPQQGRVVAVGSGKIDDGKRIPPEVKVGDTVLFSKYAGDEFKVDGEELKVLSEGDVLAIIEK